MNDEIRYMVKEAAKSYVQAGLSIIPTILESKRPVIQWKAWQEKLPSPELVETWFSKGDYAVALIGGKVSGNVEIIDIDNHQGDAEQIFYEWLELIKASSPDLPDKFVIQKTQSGGYHIIYRCTSVEGNLKLAKRWKSEKEQDTIIETRGEGGYALISPSPGYELIQGQFTNVQVISPDDREFLLEVSRSFNEVEDANQSRPVEHTEYTQRDRPGDAFNEQGDVSGELKEFGWTLVGYQGNKELWRRPGKEKGISATFNYIKDKLYCFSTNSFPFESGRTYDRFAVYTLLKHGGDFREAAKALVDRGYGKLGTNGKRKTKEEKKEVKDQNDLFGGRKITEIDLIEDYLSKNYELRYNIVKSYIEFRIKDSRVSEFDILTDRHVNEIWRTLKKHGVKCTLTTIQTILGSNFVKDFHPFKSYFKSLPEWDGEDYINQFVNLIQVEPEQTEIWFTYFNKWIVGVAACALGRGLNHNCIVLVGPQGVGKTTIIGKLIPESLKKYYAITQINPNDKDSKILISESFIINLDELESSTRDEIGHLKSLMTIEQVTVRKPYGRQAEVCKRRASFIGSVNRNMFLTDITGTRRFLTIDVTSIDLDKMVNIDQLYAQALYL
ncbi:MAG: bifunctional DNA primase/polymerase, partial [Ignavibacteriaceae bacterium]|nr:bifunctional DNA primase/polymerase [Ignavibacteriaceae bacterium]